MLQSIGRACKRYLKGVVENRKGAVSKRPCPYEGCDGDSCHIWYWGWYERLEGGIPLEFDRVCGPIPLRRFFCTKCSRTFSWRPNFLVYAHRLAAVTYQQCLKNWALGKRRSSAGWYELGAGGQKSFLRKVRRRLLSLLHRLGSAWPPDPDRRTLWFAFQRGAARQRWAGGDNSRQSIHILCMALARHPEGTLYRLSST